MPGAGRTLMPVEKMGMPIPDIETWRTVAPPKSPSQWADGRSAKEVARCWLESAPDRMPAEIVSALESHPDFGNIDSWTAEPEAKLRFDRFPGEPRNSDIAARCRDDRGEYLLAVEAKADETYGELVREALAGALERKLANARSNALARIQGLAQGLADVRSKGEPAIGRLRYQLFTASAGAIVEAGRLGFSRTVLMIQEFVTTKTADEKHAANARDLDAFVSRLTHQGVSTVEPGTLHGPIRVPGAPLIQHPPRLYIGKVVRHLRHGA